MKEIQIDIIENKALLLGDNHFETGALILTSGQEIKEGAFLQRGNPGIFELVTDTDTEEPVAIVPVTVKNTLASSLKISLRACIAGKVRADMLHVNGDAVNTDQIDLIRKYGFIPIYTKDVSRLDNQ